MKFVLVWATFMEINSLLKIFPFIPSALINLEALSFRVFKFKSLRPNSIIQTTSEKKKIWFIRLLKSYKPKWKLIEWHKIKLISIQVFLRFQISIKQKVVLKSRTFGSLEWLLQEFWVGNFLLANKLRRNRRKK